jgi:large subunit ribosomal protein L15
MSLLKSLKKITSKSKKRIGRGYGSGKGGHTVGKGQKGQTSRVGAKIPVWFEGGQLPIIKRMPMTRGKGRFKVVRPTAEITLNDLQKMDTSIISLETLKLHKVIESAYKKAKIISTGVLNKKVNVKDLKVSKKAREIIEKLGGSVE